MAVQDGDGQDLESLFSLLTNMERHLAETTDQSQSFHLRQVMQQCLLEIYLLKRNQHGKEDTRRSFDTT